MSRSSDTGPVHISGTVADGFEPVRDAFVESFRSRNELGAACAVYHRGKPVVDLWGGYRDVAGERPWEEETMVLVFSTTKGMAATAMAVAHSQGLFELDDPIATHWPSFGQNGKAGITIRQLLAHQAGLVVLDERLSPDQIADRTYLTNLLEKKRPDWEPGQYQGYHAVTLGWYMSELLHQIDGRRMRQFFAEEVTDPLDLQFYMGVDEDTNEVSVAELDGFHPLRLLLTTDLSRLRHAVALLNPRSTARKSMNCLDVTSFAGLNSPSWRSLEIPSTSGIGTARSMARMYGDLATDGDRLGIDDRTFEELTATPAPPPGGRTDVVTEFEAAYSMGYMKPHGNFRFGHTSTAFGHMGAGGSSAFADPDAEIGFAYAPNRLGVHPRNDPRERAVCEAVYRCLD